MADLAELRERLERAEGPDREIDLALGHLWPDNPPFSLSIAQQRGGKPPVFAFTASESAALALVKMKLPGWRINIEGDPSGWKVGKPPQWTIALRSPDARYEQVGPQQGGDYTYHLIAGQDAHVIQHPSLPIALCLALLRALEAQRDAGGE